MEQIFRLANKVANLSKEDQILQNPDVRSLGSLILTSPNIFPIIIKTLSHKEFMSVWAMFFIYFTRNLKPKDYNCEIVRFITLHLEPHFDKFNPKVVSHLSWYFTRERG